MKPIKVAQVCNYLADYGGNFIKSLLSVENVAATEGVPYESIFILPEGKPDLTWIKELQLKHKVFFVSQASTYTTAMAIYKICRQEDVDIAHSHFYNCGVLSIVGLLTNIKTICHFHNAYEQNPNHTKEAIKKYIQQISVDKYIGCSKTTMASLIDAGISDNKCTFVTNCINFSRLDISGETNPFDSSKNNLLILGTHFNRKGCDLALKAIEPIAEKYNIVLNIVSHNSQGTKNAVEQTMGYSPTWVNYRPTTENIGDYYKNSAIFLSPSRDEGLSYAVMEAAYCNCPVIKSDIKSMLYGLEGEDYITVTLTIEALRSKIIEVLTMGSECRQVMTTALHNQVIEKYDISAWGHEIMETYIDILK